MRSGLRVWWNWQTRYFEVVVGQPVQVQVLLRAPIFLKQLRRDGTRRMVHAEVDLAFATEFLLHAMQGLLLTEAGRKDYEKLFSRVAMAIGLKRYRQTLD